MLATHLLALALAAHPQEPPPDVQDADMVVVIGDPAQLNPTPRPSPTPRPRKAAQVRATKQPKPKVELTCSLPDRLASPYQPARVRATIQVRYPTEKFWCPAVEWQIDGHTVAEHESDCGPYDQVVAEEGEPLLWKEDQPRVFVLPQGRFTISARLLKAGRLIGSDFCTAEVH